MRRAPSAYRPSRSRDRALAGQLSEPLGEVGMGDVDGVGDVAGLELVRLAHVEDERGV
jgi:hypothetical protein